jgi:hypothetical protein
VRPPIDPIWLALSAHPLAATGTCGRLTRRKTPCRNSFRPPYLACVRHVTADEWAELERLAEETKARLAYLLPPAEPACWSWPVPPDLGAGSPRAQLRRWQANRCAICGVDDRLVEDHDHVTGKTRGLLCVSCNLGEPGGDSDSRYGRSRERPSTAMLGLVFGYVDPFGRSPITRRAPEDIDVDRSPVHQVSRQLLGARQGPSDMNTWP